MLGNSQQFLLLGFFVLLAGYTYFLDKGKEDLGGYFTGYQGCFVLMDLKSGQVERFKPAQAAKRLSPMSTFKIPNALIGLETGVVSGPDHLLAWDGKDRGMPQWNRDHTLRSAIANSVVWYFQALAAAVGPERMAHYLKLLDYGNQDISGGITRFWLGSSLLISADEQVEFLRKLYTDALPVKPENMAMVRDMLILDQDRDRTFSGKTGTEMLEGKLPLGWFVGHLQRGDRAYVFACNIQAADKASGAKAREITQDILRAKGLL